MINFIKNKVKRLNIKRKINLRTKSRDSFRSAIDRQLKLVLDTYALKQHFWSKRELPQGREVDKLIFYLLRKSPMARHIGFIGKVDFETPHITTTLLPSDPRYIKYFNRLEGLKVALVEGLNIYDPTTDWDTYCSKDIISPIRGYDQSLRIAQIDKDIEKYHYYEAYDDPSRSDSYQEYASKMIKVLKSKREFCVKYHNDHAHIKVNGETRKERR